jgi:hypothetical protein
LLINNDRVRIAQNNGRRFFEHANAPIEEFRSTNVIMGSPLEVLAARQLENTIEIPGKTTILTAPVVMNPPVDARILLAYVFRVISRPVIRYDQFKFAISLR